LDGGQRRAEPALAGALGQLGPLEVRLAGSPAEVHAAQALRYRVFYREMSAVPSLRERLLRRDIDRFDAICDHLLVTDDTRAGRRIVGTYRLLRQEVAARHGGFYSADEYDIAPLLARKAHLNFLELGRSCVLPGYRNKRTVELLWHGIWAYVLAHRLDVMIGCASLEGTDPEPLALPLSFLHHFAQAPAEWSARACGDRFVAMDRLPRVAIDPKAALRALPPLLKGYLRLGAGIGDGAVIDHRFGTTDVCVVLPVAAIRSRYIAFYGPDASRYRITTPAADTIAPAAA
jgi:putative hemolysin